MATASSLLERVFLQVSIGRRTISRKYVSTLPSTLMQQKLRMKDVNLNYVKVGNGPHNVLLIPGALGSAWTDYRPQLEYLDKSQFTLVAWDPPGYGRSTPPQRDFSAGFLHRDAELGAQLMQELGFDNYSVMGWHNGGTTAMITAAMCPQQVAKLIVWGSSSYITQQEVDSFKDYRDHCLTSPRLQDPEVLLYGQENYEAIWTRWRDAQIAAYNSEMKGDMCSTLLSHIVCPSLIIHGRKDRYVSVEHPQYLCENIKNARYHVFDDGLHHIHLHNWKEFNRLVEYFLLEDTHKRLQ